MDALEKRRNAIVDLINERGNVSFAHLKEAFPNVSEMTLRTDLKALDEAKRIVRIHGGAKSVQVIVGTDDYLNKRSVRNIEEKQIIVEKAVKLVRPDTTFFIDSGSTTTALSRVLPDQSNLIVTTGLTCAMELSKLTRPEVIVPGGKLNRYSMSVYGSHVVEDLREINFSQAFIGVTCYSDETGFTCGSLDEAELKRTAIGQSAQIIILMDSSKVGLKNTFSFCSLKDVDIIISDGKLPKEFLSKCKKNNVTVL